jgi:hypothetical protein
MTSIGSTRATVSYGAVSAAKAALESYIRQLAIVKFEISWYIGFKLANQQNISQNQYT